MESRRRRVHHELARGGRQPSRRHSRPQEPHLDDERRAGDLGSVARSVAAELHHVAAPRRAEARKPGHCDVSRRGRRRQAALPQRDCGRAEARRAASKTPRRRATMRLRARRRGSKRRQRARGATQSPSQMSTTPDAPRMVGTMDLFADLTGGRAARNTNDLLAGVKAAAEDMRGTYSVGFYAPQEPDERWHTFTVKVRRPGVKVVHRQGYLSSAATKQSEAVACGSVEGGSEQSPRLGSRAPRHAFRAEGKHAERGHSDSR